MNTDKPKWTATPFAGRERPPSKGGLTMNTDRICLHIATVGTGRDRRDVAGAICLSIERSRPDRVVLLCSRKTSEETVPCIRERLGPGAEPVVDVCQDEEDVQGLFLSWHRKWPDWTRGLADGRVVVDYTSGTKAMSAAVCLLAVARGADRLDYVTGPRDETGRAIKSTDVRSIQPDRILAHRLLLLAVEHFHAGNVAAAHAIADRGPGPAGDTDETLVKQIGSVRLVARAYDLWDRFDHKQAAATLRQALRNSAGWTWLENPSQLKMNNELVCAARDGREKGGLSPATCPDLLANAQRRMAQSAWDDAVGRLYRACEMIAQIRLLDGYQQRTSNIDPAKLPESLRETYAQKKNARGKLSIGLAESYVLLDQLGDPLGRLFSRMYGHPPGAAGELHNLLNRRNASLLAHGVRPVDKDDAIRLQDIVGQLADGLDREIRAKWLVKAGLVRFLPM